MRFARIAGLLLLAAIVMSCTAFNLGTVKTNIAAGSEIVFTPELKKLLQEIPKPKIVIRIPSPPSNVTEADKFNSYINEIEKMFVQQGFTVRDRALLENLMRGGNIDYKSIKDKIDTDLIIDVLSLSFGGSIPVHSFFNKTTQKEEPFATTMTYIECGVASLECRITIVDRGQLGGLFTLRTSPADSQELDFYIDGFRQNMAWVGQESTGMFPVLRIVIADEQRLAYTKVLTRHLIELLSGAKG
jgi:hypothetical protein